MIAQKSIQAVLDIARVEDVVNDFVTLKRRGSNLIGLCPFHDEKTPSFTVSPTKNIFKCFGCGQGGGSVQFLMEHENIGFVEAIRQLANRYNIELEETSAADDDAFLEQKKKEESYYLVNNFAARYYEDNLFNSDLGKAVGLSYFKERGFLETTIKTFNLGFAKNVKNELTQKAKEAQYNPDYLKELGLTTQNDFDFFRNRVIFPIHNLSGKIVAFAGRTLSSDKKQPKYINSTESPIYNKSRTLYGFHLAKNPVRKADQCIIVEGYTDVISLYQNSIENVVASSGTSLTNGQIRLVKRYTDNIVILYDGDPAGIKAALRGLDIGIENDMNVRLVLLPEGHDPDSFIREKGTDAFRKYLEDESKDFIFFKMDLLLEEAGNDPIKKASLVTDILSTIAKIRDTIKRALYIKECSHAFDIQERVLIRQVNKMIREEIRQKRLEAERTERRELQHTEQDVVTEKKRPIPGIFRATSKDEYKEKDLARIVIASGENLIEDEEGVMSVAEYIFTNIFEVIEFFENVMYRDIIEEAFEFIERGDKGLTNYFIHHTEKAVAKFAIDVLSPKYNYASWEERGIFLQTQSMPDKNFHKDSFQAILRFKLNKTQYIIAQLKDRIKTLEKENSDDIGVTLKALKQIQEERKKIADQLGTIVP